MPQATAITNIKTSANTAVVSWMPKTYADYIGYQVQLSTDSNFKTIVGYTTINSPKTTSATFNNLQPNTKYYARIRTMGMFTSKPVFTSTTAKSASWTEFSDWSAIKNFALKQVQAKVTIKLSDGMGELLLSAAKFKVYDKNNKFVTAITVKNGKTAFSDVFVLGEKYYLEEVTPPSGFDIIGQKIRITAKNNMEINVNHEPKLYLLGK